jgi:hypothetical protein
MKIEDKAGNPLDEATVSVGDDEIIDLLQGIADVIEGKRDHLHFNQLGGPQLVVRREPVTDSEAPLRRQMDWWLGPLVLLGAVFVLIGVITVVRWAIGLML